MTLLLLAPAWGLAQGSSAPTVATDITSSEIRAVYDALNGSIDHQAKIVDIGSGTNLAVGVLHRGPTSTEEEVVRGLVHHKVTEVYYILEGSGTLVTGGSVEVVRELSPESGAARQLVGPSQIGTSSNGHSRQVSKGDIVVIPAGVFHGFSHIEDHVSYLSIRVDPDQVLPAGYVHPVLK